MDSIVRQSNSCWKRPLNAVPACSKQSQEVGCSGWCGDGFWLSASMEMPQTPPSFTYWQSTYIFPHTSWNFPSFHLVFVDSYPVLEHVREKSDCLHLSLLRRFLTLHFLMLSGISFFNMSSFRVTWTLHDLSPYVIVFYIRSNPKRGIHQEFTSAERDKSEFQQQFKNVL